MVEIIILFALAALLVMIACLKAGSDADDHAEEMLSGMIEEAMEEEHW